MDRAHRGKGVGRRLLDHLQQWSDSQGLSRLQLAADRGNRPALDFYHRNGWSETNLMVLRRAQTHGI
ncbi:MAG: GNAT family N-acetyltransferase [Candidatus Thiodiazotropha sp. (ex Dulcina madagascariensis)]|nr:GNAT family N-acetyltransferase [Candidatus Thiodiazotropha sp. (ex Dulcina madagascariensis)]MCU7925366.1 GNAT family N-acetyltransferase [Candidatus Thiodiazotropha sp. (ex Dulcina madagascariensis)]